MIVLQIAMGTFFLGPWLNNMLTISSQIGFKPSENYLYSSQYSLNLYFGILQASLLIVVIFVSIIKPWGKRVKN